VGRGQGRIGPRGDQFSITLGKLNLNASTSALGFNSPTCLQLGEVCVSAHDGSVSSEFSG